jgi:hypothetical protein
MELLGHVAPRYSQSKEWISARSEDRTPLYSGDKVCNPLTKGYMCSHALLTPIFNHPVHKLSPAV